MFLSQSVCDGGGCHYDKHHLISVTTVLVDFEVEKKATSAVENPFSNCKSSRRRFIVEHKISHVEDTVPGSVLMNC